MGRCELCEGQAERVCGYDDQPMLDFCTEDYIEHLEAAHPKNHTAQREAIDLRKQLKKSERGLLARRIHWAGTPEGVCERKDSGIDRTTTRSKNGRDNHTNG